MTFDDRLQEFRRTQWDAQVDRLITDVETDDEPVRRGRPNASPLRQIRPTSETVKPSRSWWEDVPVGSMTRAAEQQRERMSLTREYRQVAGSIGV